jgi:hypothetical protein
MGFYRSYKRVEVRTTVPAPAATPVHQRAHHNPLYSDGSLPTIHEHEEPEEGEETALEPHVSVTPSALPALQSSHRPSRHKNAAWKDNLPYSKCSASIGGGSVFRLRSALD